MAVETTTFKYAVDQNSVNAVKRAAAELEGALNDGKTELAQYGTVSRQAMTRLESSIDAGTRALREHASAIEGVEAGYDDVASAAQRAMSAQDQFDAVSKDVALAGDFQSNLGALQGLAGLAGLGGAGQAVGAVGEIVVLAEELPRLKAAISGLPEVAKAAFQAIGTSGVGLVGALGLLGVVAAVSSNATAQAIEQQKKALEGQRLYFELVAEGTAQQIEDQRRSVETQLAIEREYSNYLTQQLSAWGMAFDQALGILSPIFKSAELSGVGSATGGAVRALVDELANAQGNITSLEGQLRAFDAALENTEVQTRSTAQAEQERIETASGWMDRLVQNEMAYRQRIEGMDAEARGQRIRNIEAEIDALKEASLEYGISDTFRQSLVESEVLLRQERTYLIGINHTTADSEKQIAAARDAEKARTDSYLDALKRVNDATEARRKLEDEFAKAAAENAAKEKQIADDLAAKEQQLAIDYGNALAKIETDGGKERERIAKDYAKRRADLEQQAYDAMAARDQEAYKRVKKQQEETEQDEEDAQKELDKRLDEQRKALKDTYDKQVADAKDAAAKLLAQEQARWANERATRQAALNQAQVDLFNALNSQRLITQTFYADQATTQQQAYSNLISMAFTAGQSVVDAFDAGVQLALFQAGAGGGTGSGSVGGGMTGIQPSPFGAGDFVPRTGGFLPSASGASRTGAGTLVNQIYLNGVLTKQEAKSLVNDGFGEFQQTYLDMIGSAA